MQAAEIFVLKDCGFFDATCTTPIMQWRLPSSSTREEFLVRLQNLLQFLADQGCQEIVIHNFKQVMASAA